MIKVIADSSCDRRELPGIPFRSIPLMISTDERHFRDDEQLDVPEMIHYLAGYRGRSFTACPSIEAWLGAFEGADIVYAITITSGLSGSYNSAVTARDLYLQEHPDTKIHIFDSLSTGPELWLLMDRLAELIQAGADYDTICKTGDEYLNSARLFFVLHSLHNLAQNGRVSKVVSAAVGVMGIRVLGTASPEGTLANTGKIRGDRRANEELLRQIEEAGYQGGRVRIAHVQNPELADAFARLLRSRYPEADLSIGVCGGLCSYYAEKGALLVAVEC